MEWKQYRSIDHWFATGENGDGYDVVLNVELRWIAIYNGRAKMYVYLSNRCQAELPMGSSGVANMPQCQFSTKEQAIAVCEKHYKLLILQ